MSTTDSPDQPQSRIDRELNEILEQARNRPISFQDRVAQKRASMETHKTNRMRQARTATAGPLRTVAAWALRVPLVTALIVALLAVWIAPQSALIGSVLALVAAALIFVPYVLKRPSDDITYQKRWRGRVISNTGSPTGRNPRSWLDSARDRFGR